jgi:hypothetical protein
MSVITKIQIPICEHLFWVLYLFFFGTPQLFFQCSVDYFFLNQPDTLSCGTCSLKKICCDYFSKILLPTPTPLVNGATH